MQRDYLPLLLPPLQRPKILLSHYRIFHPNEKPFECADCEKKFSRPASMREHQRSHGEGRGDGLKRIGTVHRRGQGGDGSWNDDEN